MILRIKKYLKLYVNKKELSCYLYHAIRYKFNFNFNWYRSFCRCCKYTCRWRIFGYFTCLDSFLGLDEATANGTNRLMVITAALVASYGYRSKGITTHPWGLYFGIVATFGAIIGAKIAIDIDGDTFKRFLAIIMISVGLIIVFRSKSIASLDLPERLSGKYLIGGLIGFFFIGVYGGFLQAGVGIVIMLLLTQINRMNLLRTNSVKAFSVFIYSIAAVLIFALDGKILWMVGLWMVLGSVAGAWLSSRWSVKKGDKVIRVTLLIMVSYMAVKLWLDTFNT